MLNLPDKEGQPNRRKLWIEKTAVKKPDPLGITFTDTASEYDNNPPTAPDEPQNKRGPKPTRSLELAVWLFDKLKPGPMRVRAIVQAACYDKKLKEDASISPLYDAKKRIPSLPDNPGWTIQETVVDGRLKLWTLVKEGQPEVEPVDDFDANHPF